MQYFYSGYDKKSRRITGYVFPMEWLKKLEPLGKEPSGEWIHPFQMPPCNERFRYYRNTVHFEVYTALKDFAEDMP